VGGGVVCTGVCVPVVFVMRAFLFAHELLVHDFFEFDHFGGRMWVVEEGLCEAGARAWRYPMAW
jgi:hypothetical protein